MTDVSVSPHIKLTIHGDVDAIVGRLRAALKAGGFSVLHQTSIGEMTGNADYGALHPSVLIGVYYPDFVYRAFVTTPVSALFLPCTYMVSQLGDDMVEVSLLDPRVLCDLLGNAYLKPIAQELYDLSMRVLNALDGT